MPFFTVRCPYCGATKSSSQNSQYKCSKCGAVITVGNNGKVKSSKPGRK